LPCCGGVLVTAAPNIWFFRDRDGDGRAEERRVVLTGFGEGNTQLRANGLTRGLDDWIYAANGRSDGVVRRPTEPPDDAVSIRRRDVRFDLECELVVDDPAPTTNGVEAISGFSQFGLPHDDWGNRFPSWNTIPIRHVVIEQRILDRNPYLAETSTVAEILDPADGGRIFGISPPQARFNRESVAFFNASCGPLIERGGLLPSSYHGNAFVCEPLSNLVHRRVLEPSGMTFIARRAEQGREFLASTDPAFRPVNLANGPDGALYVVDMYRELVEHPQFVPEPARGTVDFRRWHDRGRIWRIRPKSIPVASVNRKPNLDKADDRELVTLLGDRNAWWRMAAQRRLIAKGQHARFLNQVRGLNQVPSSVPLLRAVLKESRNPMARLHALWCLARTASILEESLVNGMAHDDPHPGLREHALRVAYELDSFHNVTTASLVRLVDDPAIRVRFQVAVMLGDRCNVDPAALKALGRIAARDAADPWMRLAILSGLAERSLAFIPLCDAIKPSEGRSQLLSQAAAIVGARNSAADHAALLGMIADRSRDKRADAMILLAGLADGLERSGTPLHTLVAAPPASLKASIERLEPLWPVASASARSGGPVPERLIALDVLARSRPDLAEAVIPGLLAASQPRDIQSAAARAVARVGRPSLADKVLDHWEVLAQATRRELLSALAGSPALAEPLIGALEHQVIAPGELDAATRQGLQQLADAALRARASAVLAKFAPPQRSAVLARYQDALKLPGDARRGEAVFAKNCQTCHQHQGHGHRVGPDLSGIAGRAPDALLSDILDPNRNIEPDYIVLAAATRRGQTLSGLLAEETATTVKLRRAEGVEDTLLRSEIEQLRSTGQSLMPEGLEQTIGPQDMADLIAFLRRGG
jgi:putative membrane-bound dehydrogenase-like protein